MAKISAYGDGGSPQDADDFVVARSGVNKKLTWANISAALNSLYVALTGDQTVAGVKTFSSFPVTPSSDPTSDYQVANKQYVDNNSGGREVLTADRTYYVRTDGNDSNDGLTNSSGGAFLTIQKAVNTAASLDISIYDVTIQVGDGTYTNQTIISGPFIGAGSVTIQGNNSTPANVLISYTGSVDPDGAFLAQNGAVITIKDLKIQTTTAGACLFASSFSVIYFQNIVFGSCAHAQIFASTLSFIYITGNYSIVGNATWHYYCTGNSMLLGISQTITLTGTPAFTIFASANILGNISVYSCTFSGSATGKRYSSSLNSVIYTAGGGASYFPGSTAGTTATGGQYA